MEPSTSHDPALANLSKIGTATPVYEPPYATNKVLTPRSCLRLSIFGIERLSLNILPSLITIT